MFADDAPSWLADDAVAVRTDAFTVFTPGRRVVSRGYLVLDAEGFRQSLSLAGATVVADAAAAHPPRSPPATGPSGVRAGGRGTTGVDPGVPRQSAVGVVVAGADDDARVETVLMDGVRPTLGRRAGRRRSATASRPVTARRAPGDLPGGQSGTPPRGTRPA